MNLYCTPSRNVYPLGDTFFFGRPILVSKATGDEQDHGLTGIEYKQPGKFNSVPNNEILDWSKLKAFADNKIKLANMMIFAFERVENIVGKGENAGHQHFILFIQCFQKAFHLRSLKSWDCVVEN